MRQRWINFTVQELRLFSCDQQVARADAKEWNFVIRLHPRRGRRSIMYLYATARKPRRIAAATIDVAYGFHALASKIPLVIDVGNNASGDVRLQAIGGDAFAHRLPTSRL